MPYKNKADRDKNYQESYLKKFGHYPVPLVRKTKEEKLIVKRLWNSNNVERCKESARKSRLKHKDKRYAETKIWIEKNKEKQKQYHKEYQVGYYQDNKEETDKRNRKWAFKNPERRREIGKKYAKTHPEEMKKFLKDYSLKLTGRFRDMKGSAVQRNYEVEISFDKFCKIVLNPCVYCGENKKRIGIDRIDNTKGYTIENSAPCCTTCNMMKKVMTVEEFIAHIRKIHDFNIINN